jgi:hypothetical protein
LRDLFVINALQSVIQRRAGRRGGRTGESQQSGFRSGLWLHVAKHTGNEGFLKAGEQKANGGLPMPKP